jgi:hypothetical protein
MTVLARELTITYGALSVGGTSGRLLDKYHYVEDSFDRASVEFEFVIAKTTEADFATEVAAVEAAFRIPRQGLTIVQGAKTLLSLTQSGNTGLDAEPQIVKQGQEGDTGRSRRYRVRIAFGRPADNASTSGRRFASIDVQYEPSRRRIVTFSGTYTAIPGGESSARKQYEAQVTTWAEAALSALSITQYEIVGEPVTEESDTGKILNFRLTYKEIINKQSQSLYDDTAIVDDVMQIGIEKVGPGDSKRLDRLANINVNYSCWIDRTVTTGLVEKYSAIRATIVSKIRATLGVGSICLVSDHPSYDWTDNRIFVSMQLLGTVGGSLLQYTEVVLTTDSMGVVMLPAWDGNPISRYVFQGPRDIIKTVTQIKRVLKGGGGQGGQQMAARGDGAALVNIPLGGGAGVSLEPPPPPPGGDIEPGKDEQMVMIRLDHFVTPVILGTTAESQIECEDITDIYAMQRVNPLKGSPFTFTR